MSKYEALKDLLEKALEEIEKNDKEQEVAMCMGFPVKELVVVATLLRKTGWGEKELHDYYTICQETIKQINEENKKIIDSVLDRFNGQTF